MPLLLDRSAGFRTLECMLPCLGSDLAEQASGQALHESSEVGPCSCTCTRSLPDEEGCEPCQGIVREPGLC